MALRSWLTYNLVMTQEADELLKRALTLSPDDRAQLAGSLIDSLDETEAAVAEAWNKELARRIEELDSGKTKTIPWEEVRRKVTAKLHRG
jgi:putative addiction module component (TIGR02574 family)